MRWIVCILLLLPLAAAQVIPLYDQIPEAQPYASCGLAVIEFARAPVGFENLHFLNGTLYLTAFAEGLYMADPGGNVTFVTKDDPNRSGPEMMGVTSHDGVLYVSQGLSVEGPVEGRIIRFDVPGEPEFQVHADGFEGGNGLVATDGGSLYLAHGFRREIYHVTADGRSSVWAEGSMPNGLDLHPDGTRLVVGQVGELGSGVETWALADPAQREQLFAFNALNTGNPTESDTTRPFVPHLMDDVTVASDGRVLLTSHERMKTLLGDPATGDACVLTEHEDSPTSVRIASEFGPWDGYAFVVDLSGTIQAVDIGLASNHTDPPPENDGTGPRAPASKESPGPGAALLVAAVIVVVQAARRP